MLTDAKMVIEQKSLGVDLDRQELRQGVMVTPFEQAKRYADLLPNSLRSDTIIACNFGTFCISGCIAAQWRRRRDGRRCPDSRGLGPEPRIQKFGGSCRQTKGLVCGFAFGRVKIGVIRGWVGGWIVPFAPMSLNLNTT